MDLKGLKEQERNIKILQWTIPLAVLVQLLYWTGVLHKIIFWFVLGK